MATTRKTRNAAPKPTVSEAPELPVEDLAAMQGLQMAFDFWKQGAVGWAELNGAALKAAGQWFGALRPDDGLQRVEAEVDHVVNPLAASPFALPAQEAMRQAMALGTAAWNDWLTWQGRVAGASGEARRL
jgi:hypothetical protein